MGNHPNIDYDKFPKQGQHLGKRVRVCFHYGSKAVGGVVIRDDIEEPWLTVILLSDKRAILSTECQYTLDEA